MQIMKQITLHTFTKTEVESLDFTRFDSLFGHWPQLWNNALKAVGNFATHSTIKPLVIYQGL